MGRGDRALKNKITVGLFAITVVIVLIALGMTAFGSKKSGRMDWGDIEIPTSGQFMYNYKYEKTLEHDESLMRANILSNYDGYDMKRQYVMIYQIRTELEAHRTSQYIGLNKEELPTVDYEKRTLLVSIGYPIIDIERTAGVDIEGEREDLVDVTYDTTVYNEGTAYVYSMNTKKILSGKNLDKYYWERLSEEANIFADNESNREPILEGEYHQIYEQKDSAYELLLYNEEGKISRRKIFDDYAPEVEEISNTMTRVDRSDVTFYFNAAQGIVSRDFTEKTFYLAYNIIAYARYYNDEVQFAVQQAYDTTIYGVAYRPAMAQVSEDRVNDVLINATYIDDTTVSIEYINVDNEVVTQEVMIRNINVEILNNNNNEDVEEE